MNKKDITANIEREVLRLIREASGYISGESIADELHVSRSAVWKHIGKLRKDGFRIKASPRLGYRLVSVPDKLMPVLIMNNISTSYIGKDIYYYPKTESTNFIASRLAMEGAVEGTVVIAEKQTKGRGRLNRNWLSPAYNNILMSIILRPELHPSKLFTLTMLSSLATVKAIKRITGIDSKIKWPNDVYINNKKIGGILTELNAEMDKVNYIVIGIGINVNFDPRVYPEIKDTATSISKEAGNKISRLKLVISILEELEHGYNLLKNGKIVHIRNEWNSCSLVLGKSVKIISFDSEEEGVAESVDDDGCLIIRDENGNRKSFISGDVSLRLNV
ncbi:MAG: biotin--[acetyl-CoA-carboxylase] ligase [Spirochaetota bacterium]|nr:biotin--[acetyl-CoA-carboxylase] ligase [Spirochaetota bacterium]